MQNVVALFVISGLILFCSAGRYTGIKDTSKNRRPTSGDSATNAATWRMTSTVNRLFAHSLYKSVARKRRGNILISPFVVSTGLSMTLLGARGQTQRELMNGLGYSTLGRKRNGEEYTAEDVPRLYKTTLERAQENSKAVTFTVASRLFGERTEEFLPEFLNKTEKYFNARLEEVDFANDPEGARARINEWVSEKTENLITDALPSGTVSPATLLTLVSSAYFKAEWENKFDPKRTKPGLFTNSDGAKIDVKFMEGKFKLQYGYWIKSRIHILVLPYKTPEEQSSNYSVVMELYLPKRYGSLDAIEQMEETDFHRRRHSLSEYMVDLSLPKFNMNFDIDLVETLQELGIRSLFGSADLSGMNGKQNLNLGTAIHKTFIAVNEEGTTAAASFAQTMLRSSNYVKLTFDHSFVIIIRELSTNTVLFMGRVENPASPE